MALTTRTLYLGLAALVAAGFPGGIMQITQTGDMIEIGSSVWLDTWGIDPRTRAEMERITRELQVVEIDGGSPVETPFDWYQPLSEPVFVRPVIQHQTVFMPVA